MSSLKRISLLFAVLLSSSSAFATGDFTCTDATGLSVSAMNGRMPGNPLIGPISISFRGHERVSLAKENVVGYWSDADQILIRAIDADYTEQVALIRIDLKKERMTLEVKEANGKVIQRKNVKTTCEFG